MHRYTALYRQCVLLSTAVQFSDNESETILPLHVKLPALSLFLVEHTISDCNYNTITKLVLQKRKTIHNYEWHTKEFIEKFQIHLFEKYLPLYNTNSQQSVK